MLLLALVISLNPRYVVLSPMSLEKIFGLLQLLLQVVAPFLNTVYMVKTFSPAKTAHSQPFRTDVSPRNQQPNWGCSVLPIFVNTSLTPRVIGSVVELSGDQLGSSMNIHREYLFLRYTIPAQSLQFENGRLMNMQ